jgi:hypothetical protein
MRELIYLDSTAIVKRYIKEPGSNTAKTIFLKAYSGEILLSFSIWNIGEVLGALDRAKRIRRIDEEAYAITRRRFLLEMKRMTRLGLAAVTPIRIKTLIDAWKLIEKHHIYEADALQIATAKQLKATKFLTGDKHLHEIATEEGLSSLIIGGEAEA